MPDNGKKNRQTATDAAIHDIEEDPDAALQTLKAAIDNHPNEGLLWLLRAIIRHGQADWTAALEDIETAMMLVPLPIGGRLVLADCYSQLGKRELALFAYRQLLAEAELPPQVFAGLFAGFRRCDRDDLALRACRRAVECDPTDHAAYFGMARCMSALNYPSVYIAGILRTAVELDPINDIYRFSLALQLVRARQLTEAHNELAHVGLEAISDFECACSASKLLHLCIWANDSERAAILAEMIRRADDAAWSNE